MLLFIILCVFIVLIFNKSIIEFFVANTFTSSQIGSVPENIPIEERCKDLTPKKLIEMYAGKSKKLLDDLEKVNISEEMLLDEKNYPLIGTILSKNKMIDSC